jgi:putative transposase
MPRPTRLNLPNIAQHVVQRGNNRQRCFFSDIDYRLYLKLLGAGCEQHRCHLHAYVLMTNHVHLLITPETPDGVSLLMRDLGRDYVRTINKVHGRSGTLWESRFKSSLVDAYHYCLNCYRYRWSSFHGNGLGKHDARITPHQVWLALGDTHDERSRRYRNLFGMELGQDTLENIRRGVGTGLPTGSRRFQNEIAKTLSIQFGTGRRGRRPKFRK